MDNTQEAPVVEQPKQPEQILYGSDTLPATFEIGGDTVQLGTIVASAFTASGLTEADWNALSDEDRDAKLTAELDARGIVAAPIAEEVADLPVIDTGAETPAVEPAAPAMEEAPTEETLGDRPAATDVISAAPPRLHASLVDQLYLRWNEVKEFISRLEGETSDEELNDVLGVARHYLKG